MQISINNTLFARSAMIISMQQSADGTCPEDNRKSAFYKYIKLNSMQVRGDTSRIYALGGTFILLLDRVHI
jgi:hypothetical protein